MGFRGLGILVIGLVLTACGSSKSGSVAGSSVTLNLVNLSQATAKSLNLTRTLEARSAAGTNAASGLISLQYAFEQIVICKSTDATTAFGFNTETGCISLYSGTQHSVGESSSLSDFLTAYSGTNQIFDLMNATDLKRLASNPITITSDQVGDYNYALVNWVPFIGVKGSITLPDSTVLATSSQGTISSGNGQPITTVSTMVGATPTLTYVKSANGGMVTKFQKPLTISADKSYMLDIIFNPQGVLRGCSGSNSGNITDGSNSIQMPMLPVTAVLRETTDSLMRETYTVTVNANFTVRIELYYLKSDSSKSILAATITDLPNYSTPNSCYGGDHRVMVVKTLNDGTLSFYSVADTSGTPMVSGLTRSSTPTGTVTFNNALDSAAYTGLPNSLTSGTVTAVSTTEY